VKTISLKKVSAVAVASLGFGLLSVVPAQAAASTTALTDAVEVLTAFTTSSTTPVAVSSATAVVVPIRIGAPGILTAAKGFTVTTAIQYKPVGATNSTIASAVTGAAAPFIADGTTTAANTQVYSAGAATIQTLTNGTSGGTLLATSAGVGTVIGQVTLTGFDKPGKYTFTVTPDGAATDVASVITVIAGYDAGGSVNVNRAFPLQGSNTTTGWAATAGGQATVRITGLADTTTYYVTVDKGSITSGVGSDPAGRTGTVTNTNGTNLAGGFYFLTTTVRLSDSMDVVLADLGAATSTVTVATYSASTGAATTFVAATVTWGVGAAPSAQYSTLGLNVTTGTAITAAASDTTATTVATTANTQRFNIMVSVKDQYDVAYDGFVLSASVTGPGSLGLDTDQDGSAPSTGRSIKATLADNAGQISIYGDGTSGTTVVTIVATTTAGVAVTLGTKTVKFAGSPSKITVTQNLYVAKAATQLGVNPSGTVGTNAAATVAATPAFYAQVMDKDGVDAVAGAVWKMTSSDTTVIVVGTCVELITAGSPATTYPAAPGNFECSVSGAVGAASGKSATVTFSVYSSTTGLYSIVATPITFTIGGAIAKSVISTDKATYTAGEAMTLLATSTDSAGTKAYDGQTPFASISSNKGFGGTNGALSLTAKEIVNGKYSTTSSKGVASVFAPSTPGSFTISGLATDAATGTAYSVTGAVAEGNAALLTQIDALNAKIVALNALIAKIMKKLGVK
jgi:hypothetical protein